MFDHVIESKERTIKNNLRPPQAQPAAPVAGKSGVQEGTPS
jgi:hypothetical protein